MHGEQEEHIAKHIEDAGQRQQTDRRGFGHQRLAGGQGDRGEQERGDQAAGDQRPEDGACADLIQGGEEETKTQTGQEGQAKACGALFTFMAQREQPNAGEGEDEAEELQLARKPFADGGKDHGDTGGENAGDWGDDAHAPGGKTVEHGHEASRAKETGDNTPDQVDRRGEGFARSQGHGKGGKQTKHEGNQQGVERADAASGEAAGEIAGAPDKGGGEGEERGKEGGGHGGQVALGQKFKV